MAGPYDYTINIPQPPAQNFLQSLLGIQQLKQLQEQSAFQQQLQPLQLKQLQEQSAFQQQLQPLQLEEAKQRLTSQKLASDAASIEFDKLKRKEAYAKRVSEFVNTPIDKWTDGSVKQLAIQGLNADPDIAKGMLNFWASIPKPESKFFDNVAMRAGIAIAHGNNEVAIKMIDKAKEDAKKLGFDTIGSFLDYGKATIEVSPAELYANIISHFSSDKEKLDLFIKASELKGKLEETEAASKEKMAQAEQIRAKIGTVDLAQDTRKLINDSSEAAVSLDRKANSALDLYERFQMEAKRGGVGLGTLSGLNEFMKRSFGTEDGVTQLRNEYTAFRNSEAALLLKDLRPASDTDVALVMKGFMSETADAAQIAKYLRGMAKIRRLEAELSMGKAEWASEFGSLRNSDQQKEINGVTVPKGTNFLKYNRMLSKRVYIDSIKDDFDKGIISQEQATRLIEKAIK